MTHHNHKGTPKTLQDAIQNGLEQAMAVMEYGGSDTSAAKLIELHVRDFLAQRFSVTMLEDAKVETLWNRIIEKKAA